ncbi:MAG: histidine phosphotransferase ChpT [Parvibaculaceae bacterium]
MSDPAQLSDLELAALLCSRVCHDVISPVGAIANGLEVLEEEDDEEMRKMAFDLVRKSANQASAKLQFCRIAFGAAGSAGAHIDMGEAGDVAKLFLGEEKVKLDWRAPRETRQKQQVKILLNLMLMAMSAIPRGGVVTIEAAGEDLKASARGEQAKLPERSQALMSGSIESTEIDARLVQVYYTLRLAEQAGYAISIEQPGQEVILTARPKTSAAAAAA